MRTLFRPALTLFLALTVLTGIVYPLLVTGVAQVALPYQANGSLIAHDGKTIGSELIGQNFDSPRYFWGRLSATTPAYNASSSSGSNFGPLNPDLEKAVKARIAALRQADPHNSAPIPVDLVTASGSGLDPHISPAAAAYQIRRVAHARGLTESQVQQLVAQHTEGRSLGLLGEARVNVLKLNLALDQMH
ncbi:MAG: potassium-transporting ATPase subunit KdpC [Abitibacteriaceae bacterium]|nr:potassium-transporting ATPase subunit KdpC [Abditibacteriaceae bacterium]MBV9864161.1 potassium-transporting ATPase subunit KdpC [Abditibacteriaceae bacterium]